MMLVDVRTTYFVAIIVLFLKGILYCRCSSASPIYTRNGDLATSAKFHFKYIRNNQSVYIIRSCFLRFFFFALTYA